MQDPDTARVDRIEQRMDVLDKRHGDTLNHIYERLNAITVTLATNSNHNIRIERVENRVLLIERQQSRLLGIGVTLVFLVTLFGPAIRRIFNLE